MPLFLTTADAMPSNHSHIDKKLETKLINVCAALQSNNRNKLLRSIKDSGVRKQAIAKGLVCNGMSPIEFAMASNADITAKYFNSKQYKDYIQLAKQQTTKTMSLSKVE